VDVARCYWSAGVGRAARSRLSSLGSAFWHQLANTRATNAEVRQVRGRRARQSARVALGEMSGPIRLPRNAPDRYGGLAVSRHASGGRSFVLPTVALAVLAAVAALTVSILALRHRSSAEPGNIGALSAPTTVYATVTVGAPASTVPAAPTASVSSPKSVPVPGFSSGVAAISVYVVQPGDSLTQIAQRLHENVQALYAQNVKTIGVNADLIFPGERLILALPS
jgi:LysM repeat protein